MVELFKEKSQCCGCGICAASCPKQAISMQSNKEGFVYPVVDETKCVNCRICLKYCPHGKSSVKEPVNCYAGSNLVYEQKIRSTSAGIFAAVASAFLEDGGLVCGAAMNIVNGKAEVKHIMISSEDELYKLQGSKYVKSDMAEVIPQIGAALEQGRKVLFSGTPCQAAGIKSIYRKNPEKLYTIDLVCHGVPSITFLNDYLTHFANANRGEITDFLFRDKECGWGHKGTVTLKENSLEKRVLSPENSSYYRFFFDGEISQDSCYKCPYAGRKRIGDLTIGDYWGVQKLNPELMQENGGPFAAAEGVSCILENTASGTELLTLADSRLVLRKVDIENVIAKNTQLRRPVKFTSKRQKIFKAYGSNGYAKIEKLFMHWLRKEKLISAIKNLVPPKMKQKLKKIKNIAD